MKYRHSGKWTSQYVLPVEIHCFPLFFPYNIQYEEWQAQWETTGRIGSSLLDIILPVLIKYFSHGSTHNRKDFMVHAKCFEWKLICYSQFHLHWNNNLVLRVEVNQQTVCTSCTCILVYLPPTQFGISQRKWNSAVQELMNVPPPYLVGTQWVGER